MTCSVQSNPQESLHWATAFALFFGLTWLPAEFALGSEDQKVQASKPADKTAIKKEDGHETDGKSENKHVFEGDVIEGGVMNFKGDVINGSYMDFKGDVIEGSRKSPRAFVELGGKSPDLDVLILNRADFNDYHDQSKGRARLKAQPRARKP